MGTVGYLDADFWGQFEAFQSASIELAQCGDLDQLAERALDLALDLTRSPVAFIALVNDAGGPKRIYSRSIDAAHSLPSVEIERIVTNASRSASQPVANTRQLTSYDRLGPRVSFFCIEPLRAADRNLGVIGVAPGAGYTAVQRRAMSIFTNQLAVAIEIANLNHHRLDMVNELVNLRTELNRNEQQRLVTEERAQAAARVERAHDLAVEVLLAVSVHARSGYNLTDFYRRLTATVAELVGAERVLFWQLNDNHTLTAIPGAHGIDDAFIARLYPAPCEPDGKDLASQVVYKDLIFRASRKDQVPQSSRLLDVLGVSTAISVPWRAGDQRLGLVAAYDSRQAEGFSREDTWVLHKAGLAAGLVWQLRQAEGDLKKTVERLQKVDAARQLLLRNVSTAVESARKRFAAELHDDALQKLTAAELHLQRVSQPPGGPDEITPVGQAQGLLQQAEDALRRLLFELRPPALEAPDGLEETIRERLLMLRSLTGIEADVELDLSDEIPYELKSLVFRQVAEALANIEKHARATRVVLQVEALDGGIHATVSDNGRGFAVAERDHLPGHLGLLALNERSLMAGGWCKVTSEPGRGTKVEFWLPNPQ
ncbi:MAG TPA: GAF domain-containing protein [Candidatus Dormibacteraeota bacterium]|nr:GAF domain-containing protein [Candidatus Dormibacteraeota bacterium]